jgi:hypothetical protein
LKCVSNTAILVKVDMRMAQIAVTMLVNMNVGAAAECAPERRHTESNDHQRNTEFQPTREPLRNRDS